MTGKLLGRIRALLRVNLDDLLMDAADPQDCAAHFLADMESGLSQVKDAVASAVAKERQLERQFQEAQALNNEWDARTDAALQAGDEEKARQALKRKLSYERAAQQAQQELDHQRQVVARMKADLSALQTKIREVRQQAKGPINSRR